MGRKSIIVLSFIAIIILAIVLSMALQGRKKTPAEKPPKEFKVFAKTEIVKYSQIVPQVKEGGRLGSNRYVEVISEVQGEILKTNVNLKRGQKFKKGNLLIKIFNEEAKFNLKASKSRFITSIANALPDLKIDYPDSYSKWMNFFNSIKMDQKLPGLPEIALSQEKIFMASRNILNDYFLIKSAEVRLSKYSIYAPFKGTFTDVMLEVGSIANPGSRIARIICTDLLELEIPVKVEDINLLVVGDKVRVTTEDESVEMEGRIIRIADFVSPATQSVSVFIGIRPNNKIKLYEGLYLTASFNGTPLTHVMEIPRNAVFNTDIVFVVHKGKLAKEKIKIHKINEKTLIFSGLNEGSEIVIEPLVNAQTGTLVEKIK